MKIIAIITIGILYVLHAHSQDPYEIRFVVRADDIGFCHSANEGIIKACKEGIATSVEIIAPSPWFMEAVRLLNENPKIDVGVHLCLTSEWTNYKWRPLTRAPSISDSNGYFYAFVWPDTNLYKRNAGYFLAENGPLISDIEAEFRAQINLVLKHVKNVSHLTAHMGCAHLNKEVMDLVDRLAIEYKLHYAPFDMNGYNTVLASSFYFSRNEDEFIANLGLMEMGKAYYLVSHPCLDTYESKQLFHPTNYDMSFNRQFETNILTSKKVMKAIKMKNIKLITIKELFDKK